MKLNAKSAPVIHIGEVPETKSFSIKATAKSFSVLTSRLYKNKIAAIIREIGCNAYDSHVAVGKSDLPFEVHVPTVFEPYFSVRDFGTGLDHKQVITIFATFFESTKEDSNDYIGALGLGSKSPFSYVDSFTVYTYDGKRMSSYECFLEDGIPRVSRRANVPSNEQVGVEITMAVQNSDIYLFHNEARSIYHWFKVRPTFTGEDITPTILDAVPLRGSCWSISRDNNNYAIMGQVCYPLDIALSGTALSGLTVHFDIGEVDVQAGREELSYDKSTIAAIKAKMALVQREIEAEYEILFRDCQDVFDACFCMRGERDPLHKILAPTFRGTVMKSGSFNAAFPDLVVTDFGIIDYKTTKDALTIFIGDSSPKTNITRFNIWRRQHPNLIGLCITQVFGAQAVIDVIGEIPFVLSSSIPLPPKKAKLRVLGGSGTKIRDCHERELDLTVGGSFLVTRNLFAINPLDDKEGLSNEDFVPIHILIHKLVTDRVIDRVAIIPWSRRNEMEGDGWVDVYDTLREYFKTHNRIKLFRTACEMADQYAYFKAHTGTGILFEQMARMEPKLNDGPLKSFIDLHKNCHKASELYGEWQAFKETFGFRLNKAKVNALFVLWENIRSEYPLVQDTYTRRNHFSYTVSNIVSNDIALYANAKTLLKAQEV